MSEKKRKVGRPSKYKEEYCEEIVEYFNKPKTRTKTKQTVSKGEIVEVEVEEGVAAGPDERSSNNHTVGLWFFDGWVLSSIFSCITT